MGFIGFTGSKFLGLIGFIGLVGFKGLIGFTGFIGFLGFIVDRNWAETGPKLDRHHPAFLQRAGCSLLQPPFAARLASLRGHRAR